MPKYHYVVRGDTIAKISALHGGPENLLAAAELAAANPSRACFVDGLPTLLGGPRVGEKLALPPMWDLDTKRAWGTMREGASECSHNGDWGAGVQDRGIRFPERGLNMGYRRPPVAPALLVDDDCEGCGPGMLGDAHPGENAPGQQGAGPTEYHPEAWDLDAGTYTVESGTTAAQTAYFAGVERPDLSNYAHELTNADGWMGYANDPKWWFVGATIKLPQKAIDNIYALACPDGYQRKSGSKNCEPIPQGQPPAKKPPSLSVGDTGSMWLLVAGVLAALGIGVAVAKSKKKGKAAGA